MGDVAIADTAIGARRVGGGWVGGVDEAGREAGLMLLARISAAPGVVDGDGDADDDGPRLLHAVAVGMCIFGVAGAGVVTGDAIRASEDGGAACGRDDDDAAAGGGVASEEGDRLDRMVVKLIGVGA